MAGIRFAASEQSKVAADLSGGSRTTWAGGKFGLSFPLPVTKLYCNGLSVVAQFGEGPALAVPAAFWRITPEASEQKAR